MEHEPILTISKTVYEFTVLHPTQSPPGSLEDALRESMIGHMVGDVTFEGTEVVPSDRLLTEVQVLGGDESTLNLLGVEGWSQND